MSHSIHQVIRNCMIGLIVAMFINPSKCSSNKTIYNLAYDNSKPLYMLKSGFFSSASICGISCSRHPNCLAFSYAAENGECSFHGDFVKRDTMRTNVSGVQTFSEKSETYGIKLGYLPTFAVKTLPATPASQAMNGEKLDRFCFKSDFYVFEPYWIVDLRGMYQINMVIIHALFSSHDNNDDLHDVSVEVYTNDPFSSDPGVCCKHTPGLFPLGPTAVHCRPGAVGDHVKLFMEKSDMFAFCEVEIYAWGDVTEETYRATGGCPRIPRGVNLALNRPVRQSSTLWPASLAVDGTRRGDVTTGVNCSSTDRGDAKPWLMVDLGSVYTITSFTLANRRDKSLVEARMVNVSVGVYISDPRDSNEEIKHCKFIPNLGFTIRTFQCDDLTVGRFVRVSKSSEYLEICELEVTGNI